MKSINQKQLVQIFKDVKELDSDETRFCFLLGAGASVSSGIPTGWTLAKEWYEDLKKVMDEQERKAWETKIGFDEERIGEFYPQLYEKRYESSPQLGYAKFKKLMEKKDPSLGYVILAQVLAKEKHNFVITTNFDYLIEDAVRMYTPTKPFVAGHETLAPFVEAQTERPTIVKIHRDLFLNPINDEKGTEALKEEWKRALRPILRNFYLLVVGYGGNDGSLMNYLAEIEPEERKSIYWCTRGQDKLNHKAKKLLKPKDYHVCIDSFDELMYAFNEALEYDISKGLDSPEEHEFVKLAIKRIQNIYAKLHEIIASTENSNKEISNDIKALLKGVLEYHAEVHSEKDVDLKEKIFKEGLEHYPNDSYLLGDYGTFLYDTRKDFRRGKEMLEKSLDINPNNPTVLMNYAILLSHLNEYDNSRDTFHKALRLDNDNISLVENYATFLMMLGERRNAIASFKKAIRLSHEPKHLLSSYATLLSNSRDFEKAEEFHRKALDKNLNDTISLGNYAHHLILSKQDFEQAQKYIDKAFKNKPTELELSIELYFYLYAHYSSKRKKAEKEIEKLLSQGAKSKGWNLQAHVDIAIENQHPNPKKLQEYADKITAL